MSVRPLGSAGEGSRDERPLHTRGRGQPSCCSGASAALGRRETGRALEAGLREDGRQVVRLQGVDEVVDAVRAGRVRRGLRREDRHDDVAVQGILAERELVGVARAGARFLVLGEVASFEDVLRAARGRRVEGLEDAASALEPLYRQRERTKAVLIDPPRARVHCT